MLKFTVRFTPVHLFTCVAKAVKSRRSRELLTNIAIELLNHQIKANGSLELNKSFHILSSTGFPYLEKHGDYRLFNIELVKAMIAITSLIMAIWPNMKGAADFSLLFKKNKILGSV